ncbi:MAG: hypothetical protein K9M45_07430 [Kiritimatiellales bacterium]|nr:hypothetical protein [Kiritimatiellales bacterium]
MKTGNKRKKEGFALFAVLFAIAAISSLLVIMMFNGMQRIHMARKLSDRIRAKAIAESGCENAYALLSTDFELRNDPSAFDSTAPSSDYNSMSDVDAMPTAFSDETYDIGVVPVGDSAAIVSSTGYWGSAIATAIIGVQNYGGSSEDGTVVDAEAFSYAILCGGEFDFSGCGTIASPEGDARFHSNGGMFLRGTTDALIDLSSSVSIVVNNGVTIGGDVTAPDFGKTKWSKVTVGGTLTTKAVAPVTIPDIDLTPYYNYALKKGEVHNGFTTTTDVNPNGGILWVNGDFHMSAHAVINGSVIATGDINLSGQIDINPTTCAFSVVSRDGDIQVTSSGTINGLMYAKTGGLQHTANGLIVGQIIVNGNIKKAGNSDIMTGYAQSIPTPPGGSPNDVLIGISAWQE